MKKGFTLIEMAIVLLVLGILAGVVLRNIGGQSAVARDTRRVGDLKNVSNYLATYLGKFGVFPTSTTWSDLESVLRQAGIVDRLPRDPSGGSYDYYPCSDLVSAGGTVSATNTNHFVLRARLEQTTSSAPRLWENAVTSISWTCNPSPTCDPNQRYYCFAQ